MEKRILGSLKTTKEKTRDWGSRHPRTASIFKYGVLFLLSALIFAFIFAFFNLYHTDADSARYMLSALVQSQAAIVAIVVSLTLIAVQLTASAYSPRVIRIFRDNFDMWLLLGLYGGSIFYGLLVLKMIRGEDLSQIPLFGIPLETHISYALLLGFFSIVMLFQYMWNIINLLNPTNIIKRLSEGVTKDKILKYIKLAKTSEGVETSTVEDPIQPIMDIIHGSIMKYDLETTRVGLKAVTDQVTKIIELGREVEISSHFCHHLERVSRLAISKMDEESAIEVIESIGNFGLSTARKGLGVSTWYAVVSLGSVGGDAARKGLAHAEWEVAESLGIVGKAAVEKRLEGVTEQAVRSLRYIGKATAERGLGSVIVGAARSLVVVGTIAIKNGLEDVTRQAAESLAELTILSEETVKDDIQNYEESILKEQDRDSFQKFMKIYEQKLEKRQAEK